jgi:hypothetical protein
MGGGVGVCCAKARDAVPRLANRTATNKFLCFIGYVGFELRTKVLKYSKILEIWNTADGFLIEMNPTFPTLLKILNHYEKVISRSHFSTSIEHASIWAGRLLLPG